MDIYKLMNHWSVFKLESGTVTNYLDEEFDKSFKLVFVEHLFHRISKVEIPSLITRSKV